MTPTQDYLAYLDRKERQYRHWMLISLGLVVATVWYLFGWKGVAMLILLLLTDFTALV